MVVQGYRDAPEDSVGNNHEYLLSSEENKHIIIWSDSLSSIQALSSLSIRSKTTQDCFTSINSIATNNTVEIRWIAAHSGLWGNEKADEMAKLGTTNDVKKTYPIPESYIKSQIDHKINHIDTANWTSNPHRHTKMTISQLGPNTLPSRNVLTQHLLLNN